MTPGLLLQETWIPEGYPSALTEHVFRERMNILSTLTINFAPIMLILIFKLP